MFAIIVKVCRFVFLFYFKHLRSSQSRWRVVSWSCGWRKSSICPGSCAGRRGWSWSTGSVRTSPLAPGWRESEAGWWGTRGTWGPIAQVGSGSGASRWIQTDWTWGTGCGYPRSMAVRGEREMFSAFKPLFFLDFFGCCPKLYPCITHPWHYLTLPVTVLCLHRTLGCLFPAVMTWLSFLCLLISPFQLNNTTFLLEFLSILGKKIISSGVLVTSG